MDNSEPITGRVTYRGLYPINSLDLENDDMDEEIDDLMSKEANQRKINESVNIRDHRVDRKLKPLSQQNKEPKKHKMYQDLPNDTKTSDQTNERSGHSKDDVNDKKQTGFNWIYILLAIAMALIVSYLVFDGQRFLREKQNIDSVDNRTKWEIFKTEFESFERIYSEVIPIRGIKVMNASVKSVMTRNTGSQQSHTTSPAIILLIASKEDQNILKCVERDFVNSINKAYNENNPIVINGNQTDATDIVDKFDNNFRDQQKHTIVIENMESINPKDVMSLHQFTDHENAKYKDVIIVLTAIHYRKFNLRKDAKSLEMDQIATQLLEIKWKNALPGEQSYALISRLTPSVVTIIGSPEDKFEC